LSKSVCYRFRLTAIQKENVMAISATTKTPIPAPLVREPAATPAPEPAKVEKAPATPSPKIASSIPDTSSRAKRTTLDQATGDLVYQVIDQRTGQELSQSPDEAILRMRAYTRQLDAAKLANPAAAKTQAKG
jgi:uncharacterized iron-regulated membrane protein